MSPTPPTQDHSVEVEADAGPEPSSSSAPAEPAEPSEDHAGVIDQPSSPSAFELARRILAGVMQSIEDGADLLGASVREELGRFRTDIVRSLLAVVSLAAGGGLVTAGLALLLHAWIGSWPPVLLVLGGAYLAVGAWLFSLAHAPGGDP